MKSPLFQYSIVVLYALTIVFLGHIPTQSDFGLILGGFTLAFASYIVLCYSTIPISRLIIVGTIVRVALVFMEPQLSDDIYRFIWDGRLMHLGLNPYGHLPSEIVGSYDSLSSDLYHRLNSPDYYTIYPPLAQIVNYISTLTPTDDYRLESILFKSILLLFEIGAGYVLLLLCRVMSWSHQRLSLYYLNPLLIIEVMGNCHFEGVMLFFLLLMIYSFAVGKHGASGASYSFSILSKALPLLYGPLIFFSLIRRKWSWYFVWWAVGVMVFGILPIILTQFNTSTDNISDSIGLYIQKFEFNGSIYYLLRSIGYTIYGFNLIHVLGPALSGITLICILYVSYRVARKEQITVPILISSMLLIYMIFILLSRTVHPWYTLIPLLLGILSGYRFTILWSYLVTWTYINYSYPTYHENLIVVFLEYALLLGAIWYELQKKKPVLY